MADNDTEDAQGARLHIPNQIASLLQDSLKLENALNKIRVEYFRLSGEYFQLVRQLAEETPAESKDSIREPEPQQLHDRLIQNLTERVEVAEKTAARWQEQAAEWRVRAIDAEDQLEDVRKAGGWFNEPAGEE